MPISRRGLSFLITVMLASATLVQEAGAESSTAGGGSEGVAGSGMSQGSGAITTRSDVALSVESLPGTSALRLGAIGEAVGTQMTAIRACYVEVTEERPTTEGTLRIRVQIPQSGAVRLEVAENTTGDTRLTNCVVGALRSAPIRARVQTQAGGLIVIQFQNTAARGAAMVQQEQQSTNTSAVQTVDGQPQARGSTPQNEVVLTIRGTGSTSAEAVSSLYRNAQARIGTLLDCRRRAGRRDQDPSGEMVLNFTVPARGAATGRRVSSSVADSNAPQCVIRSLGQAARGQSAAAGTYRITVRFAPR